MRPGSFPRSLVSSWLPALYVSSGVAGIKQSPASSRLVTHVGTKLTAIGR